MYTAILKLLSSFCTYYLDLFASLYSLHSSLNRQAISFPSFALSFSLSLSLNRLHETLVKTEHYQHFNNK